MSVIAAETICVQILFWELHWAAFAKTRSWAQWLDAGPVQMQALPHSTHEGRLSAAVWVRDPEGPELVKNLLVTSPFRGYHT